MGIEGHRAARADLRKLARQHFKQLPAPGQAIVSAVLRRMDELAQLRVQRGRVAQPGPQ